jgi:predicted RecA/RadA family phage recombinase
MTDTAIRRTSVMEFHERQIRLGRRPVTFGVVAALASLLLASAAPAEATRFRGTKGPDKIAGTAKADVIKSLRGDDRIKGRGGRDRLFGGRGADRLNAVDGRRDRVVSGGPGNDICRVDATDQAKIKGCETVMIAKGGGPGTGGGGPGTGQTCASPPAEPRLVAGGLWATRGDAPPSFSDPFYAITITLNASADGLNGDELPISIEGVCDVPKRLESEAAQLAGGEAVALISSETKAFDAGGQQLTGEAATTALAGADTVSLKAQLQRPARWRQDEDGQPVPTFQTSRVDITD